VVTTSMRRVTILWGVTGSLLRTLSTQREPSEPIRVRYDDAAMVSHVYEDGRWVPSWESREIQNTKKCDHETGEDQKGA
jgi:hypothetical protein